MTFVSVVVVVVITISPSASLPKFTTVFDDGWVNDDDSGTPSHSQRHHSCEESAFERCLERKIWFDVESKISMLVKATYRRETVNLGTHAKHIFAIRPPDSFDRGNQDVQ